MTKIRVFPCFPSFPKKRCFHPAGDCAVSYTHLLAAEQGHAPAQCNLGVCCLNGIGMEADAPQGVEWLERAAAQDFARALCILADCCKTGSGLAQDQPRAMACLLYTSRCV